MKKRNLLLIPIAACLIVSAAALGYVQSHPESAPEKLRFLAGDTTATQTETEDTEDLVSDLSPLQQHAFDLTERMTLEQKLYQLFFVRPETLTGVSEVRRAGNTTQECLEQMPVGGLIYEEKNIQSSTQLTELLEGTQSFARQSGAEIPLFLGIEEEGGTYAPVAQTLKLEKLGSASFYADKQDAGAVYTVGKTLAHRLMTYGFNVDFAPVADVLDAEDAEQLGTRSFGSDAAQVSEHVAQEVNGLQENGMMSVLKKFPGESGVYDGFIAGIEQKAAFIQVSNVILEDLDSIPCSLSSKVMTDLLRDTLDYDGIILTDALDSEQLSEYTQAQAAVLAIQAGADMIYCPSDIEEIYTALYTAVEDGTLTEERINESVRRILYTKLTFDLLE